MSFPGLLGIIPDCCKGYCVASAASPDRFKASLAGCESMGPIPLTVRRLGGHGRHARTARQGCGGGRSFPKERANPGATGDLESSASVFLLGTKVGRIGVPQKHHGIVIPD